MHGILVYDPLEGGPFAKNEDGSDEETGRRNPTLAIESMVFNIYFAMASDAPPAHHSDHGPAHAISECDVHSRDPITWGRIKNAPTRARRLQKGNLDANNPNLPCFESP